MDPKVYYSITYGMFVLGVISQGKRTGCVVNTVFQVTAEPPVLAVSVNKENLTHEAMVEQGRFAISVLSTGADARLIGLFGYHSGRDTDKDQDGDLTDSKGGLPVLTHGAVSYLECEIVRQVDMDTHTLFMAKVLDGDVLSDQEPMTYGYYQTVLKGKSPKLAPTYRAEAGEAQPKSSGKAYVCQVCGYVYDESDPAFEDLPDDWVCPICGVPKSMFSPK